MPLMSTVPVGYRPIWMQHVRTNPYLVHVPVHVPVPVPVHVPVNKVQAFPQFGPAFAGYQRSTTCQMNKSRSMKVSEVCQSSSQQPLFFRIGNNLNARVYACSEEDKTDWQPKCILNLGTDGETIYDIAVKTNGEFKAKMRGKSSSWKKATIANL